MLECADVTYECQGRKLVDRITFEALRGQFWGVLGPNGAGKSTLLKLLSGRIQPTGGSISIDGHPVRELSAARLARLRAVLSQNRSVGFSFRTEEVVMLGRHPYLGSAGEQDRDHELVREAMTETDSLGFAGRVYSTLSGGESSRVDMARVLAQQTPVLFLDEPTNHLDPKHQVSALEICHAHATAGQVVIAALHDLNLAAAFAHRVIVLKDGEIAAIGPPAEVLTESLLGEVYEIPFEVIKRPSGGIWIIPVSGAAAGDVGDRRQGNFASCLMQG